MVLLIDNYDSFTYLILQYLRELNIDVKIIKNDELTLKEIKSLNPEKIVISPGPATPSKSGISKLVVKEFYTKIPILGICLGHQVIAEVFNAKIIKAKKIMHGKKSLIKKEKNSIILDNIEKKFYVARYHSLVIDKNSINENIIVTSKSSEDEEIMSIEIKDTLTYGIQFHPESIQTKCGKKIFKNFVDL